MKNIRIRQKVVMIGFLLTTGAHGLFAAGIELNVVTSSRSPFGAGQRWALELAKLKNVRPSVVGGQSRPRPDIKRRGTTTVVTAVIDSSNRLVVPGRTFSIQQRASLQNWLEQQSRVESGKEVSKDRFELTTTQLKNVHEQLKSTVAQQTKGESLHTALDTIARGAGVRLRISSRARRGLTGQSVREEWQGFTSGTAMAAILRPVGLAMKPVVDAAKRTELHVDAASGISESWPVGWKSQLKNRELVPKIYDPLPVEIKETPIREVTAAIEGLLETPMFYDEAMLQKAKINPDEKLVTYESARSIFIKTITHSLFKADLKHELRVDERGKAFFWIVPRRPIK